LDYGMLSLGSYMWFWAVMYFIVTFLLLFFPEKESSSDDHMQQVYIDIWRVISIEYMQIFVFILLTSKIGFVTDDSVSGFKYMEKGWKEEDLGLTSLINFPLQIIFGYYAAKWSQGERKLKPWLYAFYGRLFMAIVDTLTVWLFPAQMSTPFFLWVISTYVLCNFMRYSCLFLKL
jgi:MFS transporter, PAT family, solute carrier family 33 (acetyl-CoA transportor), member 1